MAVIHLQGTLPATSLWQDVRQPDPQGSAVGGGGEIQPEGLPTKAMLASSGAEESQGVSGF